MERADADMPPFDMAARWIRVTEVKAPFVLFEFTLGDPDLMVEMVMPIAALFEFRDAQRAELEIADAAVGAFSALARQQ
ncbi:phenol hydroxylase subunit [Zavarzinia compransoris]|uniref:phenol hydroxylase subunit n=1 Tax=Zavarzinia marina TaxID=2911065 RepID=UPI001F3A4CBE|nr:phenol hydroxylase subunit [Zavarzinia marina]MCF4165749.1 phenol hydroxylase subunit [Zavarzinia marina]